MRCVSVLAPILQHSITKSCFTFRGAKTTLQSAVASFTFPDTPLPHIVAVDWTEFRGFMCLVAGRVARGVREFGWRIDIRRLTDA